MPISPHQVPERQVGRRRPPRIERREKDISASGSRLPLQDGARGRIQDDPPRPGLGIGEIERVPVDVLPAHGHDLVLAAAGQQEKADDVHLLCARRPRAGMVVQRAVKALDLLARQEAGELRAGIALDALRMTGSISPGRCSTDAWTCRAGARRSRTGGLVSAAIPPTPAPPASMWWTRARTITEL